MRHAAKRDDTEPAIVQALELAGWTVVKVSDTGFPDLACFRRGVVRFLECKGPDGALTPAQEKTFGRIQGALVTVHVVRTPEEALMAVGAPVEGVLQPLTKSDERCACSHDANAHHNVSGHCMTGNCECLGGLVESVLREERRTGNLTPTHVPKRRK